MGLRTQYREQTSGQGAILRARALAKPATAQAPFPCRELEGAEGEPSECRGGTGERTAGAGTEKVTFRKVGSGMGFCLPEDLQQAVLLSLRCPCII